jgi:hypothetical protein
MKDCDSENCKPNIKEIVIKKSGLWNVTAKRLAEGFYIKTSKTNVAKTILDPTVREIDYLKKHNMV